MVYKISLDSISKIGILDTNQPVEIGECHIEVKLSTDRIMEIEPNVIKITEVTLGEGILKEIKITEVKLPKYKRYTKITVRTNTTNA